jgi:putative tricarboxylic transport membrane protein
MRVLDVITAALLMLLSAIVIYDALRLGYGWGAEGPLSGFFPFWLAALLAAVSIVLLVQALRHRSQKPFVTRERFLPVLQVLGPLAGFVVLTDPPGPWSGLGLYVAAGLYLGFYMRWVGRHDWRTIVAHATVVPVISLINF